uniref:NADH-ubiquinone oxidoreductase chain 3 n=1 Tax=Pupilla muscorum TaxID=225749 RepID=A0A0A6ZAH3_9EUPU|nr:NADH dehydrogenase subunit 3 [Pupilla muscorum]AGC52872.1 NADH dehydrogenase subunit 3 [Pupilla muscorum]
MIYYVAIPLTITMLFFILYLFLSWNPPSEIVSKGEPFECGFDPFSKIRKPFSLRFFLLIILFLIFDVEVVLLFPILMLLKSSCTTPQIISFTVFLIILIMGLFYEWKMGALEWIL